MILLRLQVSTSVAIVARFCPKIVACEQRILSLKRDGAHRSLDGVVVEVDPAIVEEPDPAIPVIEGIADGFGRPRPLSQFGQHVFQPGLHIAITAADSARRTTSRSSALKPQIRASIS